MGIVPEESPVGSSASNSKIERAIQSLDGQQRAILNFVEDMYGRKLPKDHVVLPWLVKYATFTLNIGSVGEDGKTPWARRRGEKGRQKGSQTPHDP